MHGKKSLNRNRMGKSRAKIKKLREIVRLLQMRIILRLIDN